MEDPVGDGDAVRLADQSNVYPRLCLDPQELAQDDAGQFILDVKLFEVTWETMCMDYTKHNAIHNTSLNLKIIGQEK